MDSKGIQFYGAAWCGDCVRAKQVLDDNEISYQFHDIDNEAGAVEKVMEISGGMKSIPVIIFLDGEIMVEPSDEELKRRLNII